MTTPAHETRRFAGRDGVMLAADVWGSPGGSTVLMLHGGGQTRHSWKATGAVLAEHGFRVVTLDTRGHGDSDWSPDGEYGMARYRDDVLAVLTELDSPAVIIGASLGGLTGIHVARTAGPERVPGLVLVDVVPRVEDAGGSRIASFMRGNPDGFASLEDAADAVADYLPHRRRPRSADGLRRNLRQRANGRWYWHWDPRMLSGRRSDEQRTAHQEAVETAARELEMPVLLLWGRMSDVVSAAGVEEFRELVPHADVVSLAGAAHTAAGDDNDAFSAAVIEFCTRFASERSGA